VLTNQVFPFQRRLNGKSRVRGGILAYPFLPPLFVLLSRSSCNQRISVDFSLAIPSYFSV
jgi:hypothetical protein